MPLGEYTSLLRRDGRFIQVGNPDDALQIPAGRLIGGRVTLCGSMISSPSEIREMLELAAQKKISPMIEERPMQDANSVILDMEAGKARYRYVLVNPGPA